MTALFLLLFPAHSHQAKNQRARAGFNAKRHVVGQESDCVIVSPRNGVLLLEIKGPSLERQDDGLARRSLQTK